MKKILTLLLLPMVLVGQTEVNSTIDNVTVFTNGAQVVRKANVSLQKGDNSLIIKNLSQSLDPNSIQISTKNDLTILSLNHRQVTAFDNEKAADEIEALNAKIAGFKSKIGVISKDLNLLKKQEDLLLQNQRVGGEQSGMKPADLKAVVDYFKQEITEVVNKQYDLNLKLNALEDSVKTTNRVMTNLRNSPQQTTSEITLIIAFEKSEKVDLTLSYFVKEAGWKPNYDLKITNISMPLRLLYKADVYQYTGEDWKNVRLTLSNANPKQNGEAPELKTWYWGEANSYEAYQNNIENEKTEISQVNGVVTSASDNTPIIGANVLIMGTTLGTVTNENGFYQLAIPPDLRSKRNNLSFSYIGFVNQNRFVNASNINVSMQEDAKALEEVVVVGYGVQRKKEMTGAVASIGKGRSVAFAAPQAVEIKQLMNESDAPTSLNFELKEKFSVPSDGKEYTAELKELQIPAQYEYTTIPKIDNVAFLKAKIIDWEQYNLLPGAANLYFEGTYLGESALDLSNEDTLNISMGRDKQLIIKRERIKTYQKKQCIGGNKIDTYGYEIEVRNTKSFAANLIVMDQFPLSKYKVVEVYDTEAKGATVDAETGKISWNLNLAPNESRTLQLKYTVKYPKDQLVEVK
ncbi:MAG: mucoidy inhibitor MuiA family protein [Spirosomaceae bacterium]|nr:mucoidy inhibitor MuiA family protein [Spirosomataceae bacterium]